MFRPIPHLSGKKAACNREEERFELIVDNLLPCRKGQDAIEYGFIKVRYAHFERSQHTGPISLHEAILAEICLQISSHQNIGVELLTIADGPVFPGLKILVDLCHIPIR